MVELYHFRHAAAEQVQSARYRMASSAGGSLPSKLESRKPRTPNTAQRNAVDLMAPRWQ